MHDFAKRHWKKLSLLPVPLGLWIYQMIASRSAQSDFYTWIPSFLIACILESLLLLIVARDREHSLSVVLAAFGVAIWVAFGSVLALAPIDAIVTDGVLGRPLIDPISLLWLGYLTAALGTFGYPMSGRVGGQRVARHLTITWYFSNRPSQNRT